MTSDYMHDAAARMSASCLSSLIISLIQTNTCIMLLFASAQAKTGASARKTRRRRAMNHGTLKTEPSPLEA